jgi:tRNA G18 (ribose-2'-O)-methylase SpoU
MIPGVPAPELITDPADERVADFRDLVAGDRRPGTERGTGPIIVEGVPAVERLLASPYPVRTVFGIPGRVADLDLPPDVAAYEADRWVLSEVIGFRLTRGVLASADRLPPLDLDTLITGPDPAAPRRLAVLEGPAGLDRLHQAGYRTVALTPAADAVDLTDIDARAHPRTVVMLGAEGPGLTPVAQRAAQVRARIPMRSGVDSLGVAAAAAVAFATLR